MIHKHSMRLVIFHAYVSLLCAATAVAVDPEPIDIGERRELFVDDYLIDSMANVIQHVHRPEPREVVLVTDQPWEGNTSAYYTIFQDGDLYRMYYRGSHFDEQTKESGHIEVTCYAESKDGIRWTKPNLGLFEFDGSKNNNIVWDGIGTHCFAAFKDNNPQCPPAARYKAISRGKPRGKKGLYVFESPDGIRWQLIKSEPVITEGAFDSQNLAFWDEHTEQYREYHRTFVDRKRAIMTGTSQDFVNWTEPQLLKFQPGLPAQHLYTNAIRPYARAPHLLLGFPTRYLPAQGQRVEPTFMSSRDGLHFHRWLEAVVPESAPQDRGGNRSNYMAWGLLELPGAEKELSVYATEAYYTGPDSRVRRFVYRKDGFVSVRADQRGALTSKPIRFSGSGLALNVVSQGEVRVEIQDSSGNVVPGFEAEKCTPISGNFIDRSVTWESDARLEELAGQPIRLKFLLYQADLFAFQFAGK